MRMYVVRVIDEAGDDALHGTVRRVSDGVEQPFHGDRQLVELLWDTVRPGTVTTPGRQGS